MLSVLAVIHSTNRYSKGQRGIAGEQPYSHFLEAGHKGIEDMRVKIIDKTNVNDLTNREGFWAYKLNSFIPQRLNLIINYKFLSSVILY